MHETDGRGGQDSRALRESSLPPVDGAAASRSGGGSAADEQPTNTWSAVSGAALPGVPTADRIGGYAIGERLGEGGMGVVYAATQDRPHRSVALKLIKPGRASPDLLRRFELEAEILGRLQHPGIAHIYEAGQADLGNGPQPYFAMELVRGHTLLEYAAARKLSIKQRLELAARVADAVHYAHQQGVIHRDLKPGNVVVGGDGQPKILDFGVARVTDSDVSLTTADPDVPRLIGTLAYMSPEQARGQSANLDTRSDVYALGVILYELLTGRLPHDLARKPLHEAARIVVEEEPPRVSSINRALRGDVATIVEKALERDKDRRYASANALATDIRRYLSNEAIAARPAGAWYQLAKFAQRNKILVGGVAATIAALSLGLSVAVVQAREARRQEGLAAIRATEAATARDLERNARLEAELQTASLARQRGDWKTALRHFDAVRKSSYGDPVTVRLGIIDALSNSMHPFEALAEAEALATEHGGGPRRAEILFSQGNLYFGLADRHDDGVLLLEQALDAGLTGAKRAYAQGLLVETVPESIAKFREAVALDTWMIEARVWLGCMLIFSGRLEDAARELGIAGTFTPDDPKVVLACAAALALKQRREEALACIATIERSYGEAQAGALRELIILISDIAADVEAGRLDMGNDPRLVSYILRFSTAIAAMGFGSGASGPDDDIALLDSIAAGNYPRALRESWGRLIPALLMSGDSEEARREIAAAARANPEGFTLFIHAFSPRPGGSADGNSAQLDADAFFRAAETPAILPIGPLARQIALGHLIALHKKRGELPAEYKERFLVEARKALTHGVYLGFITPLASVLRALGEMDLAVAVLRTALTEKPNDPGVLFCVAYSEYERGAYDKAIEACAHMLEIEPGNEQAVELLKVARSMLGKIGPPRSAISVEEFLQARGIRRD